MSYKYFTVLTDVGKQKLAEAIANETALDFTEMAVGDSNGTSYEPTSDMTALKHVTYRAAIGSMKINAEDKNIMEFEFVVPASTGGFYVREAGLYSNDGTLIAISRLPEQYKADMAEGAGSSMTVRILVAISSDAQIYITVPASITYATQTYVIEEFKKHKADSNPHEQYVLNETYSAKIDELQKNINSKAANTHNHDSTYLKKTDASSTYLNKTDAGNTYATKEALNSGLAGKAASNHTHSNYAANNHNHDNAYSKLNHTHSNYYECVRYRYKNIDLNKAGNGTIIARTDYLQNRPSSLVLSGEVIVDTILPQGVDTFDGTGAYDFAMQYYRARSEPSVAYRIAQPNGVIGEWVLLVDSGGRYTSNMPMPIEKSGIGQVYNINANNAFWIPEGASWLVSVLTLGSQGNWSHSVSIVEGGYNVSQQGNSYFGWAVRIK